MRAGRPELQIPVEVLNFSPNYPDRVRGPPILLFNWYLGSVSGIKRTKCEFNPPSSAEIKNEWSYTSIPPICPHGVDINKFYIYISLLQARNKKQGYSYGLCWHWQGKNKQNG